MAQRLTAAHTTRFHSAVSRSSRPSTASDTALKVLQLNCLSHRLTPAPVNQTVEALHAVDPAHRWPRNVAHIEHLSPHIAVLEEVDDPTEHYLPALEALGYGVTSAKKIGGQNDYTCLCYNTKRLVESSPAEVFRFATEQTPQISQFILLCHFTDKVTSTEFVVVAQHAKAGRTDVNEDIRFNHAQRVLDEALPEYLARTLRRPGAPAEAANHILWVGDFNAGPHTYGGRWPAKMIPWLLGEGIDAVGPPPSMVFESAMKQYFGDHPLFTTCKLRGGELLCQCIDYILFPRGSARCVGSLPCPSQHPETELAPLYLPSGEWGSDHLSVYAEIVWSTPNAPSSL